MLDVGLLLDLLFSNATATKKEGNLRGAGGIYVFLMGEVEVLWRFRRGFCGGGWGLPGEFGSLFAGFLETFPLGWVRWLPFSKSKNPQIMKS